MKRVQFVPGCGEDIEILESFTYLDSIMLNNGGNRFAWPLFFWFPSAQINGTDNTCEG